MIIAPGAVSQSITVQIVDDSGLAVTGLVAATFPPVFYERVREAAVAITPLVDLVAITSAYAVGGVKEVSGGYYRLDTPNAMVATASPLIRVFGEVAGKHLLAGGIECRGSSLFREAAADAIPILTFRQGDVNATLADTLLYQDGTAINLTGKTLRFYLTPILGGTPVVNGETGTVDNASTGDASFVLEASDLAVAGTYFRKWQIVSGDGSIVTYPDNARALVRILPQ